MFELFQSYTKANRFSINLRACFDIIFFFGITAIYSNLSDRIQLSRQVGNVLPKRVEIAN